MVMVVDTDELSITVYPLPNVNAGADQALCEGNTIVLGGSGAISYSWNNGINNLEHFNPW